LTRHILAVDDDPHMLRLLERIVAEKTPYGISTTSNSFEVPRLLQEGQFDVVVTDLRMPGLDGLDILRLVHERGGGEQVIIITAFGTLDTAMEALSGGVFDYINKPFRKEEFLFTIHRAMRWIDERREAERLAAIFDLEPYQRAQHALEAEYAARLRRRTPGDLSALAERSGIDANRLEQLLTP
jgi:DNA-binding NtrC family response regulator